MKQTQLLMGMPITVELIDKKAAKADIKEVFSYFNYIDEKFSTYKQTSEISKINQGLLKKNEYSHDMKTIFRLSEQTKNETRGYFDVEHEGKIDPSGLVKGWAVYEAAKLLQKKGLENFYIEAGGDIQISGKNSEGKYWTVGIRNPFDREEIVKVVKLYNKGIATSGTYIRGQHIYNPKIKDAKLEEVLSLTVIGPNVYEADRFATAAFAMGKVGIGFIENLPGFEGYLIDKTGTATYTSGFKIYL